MQWLDEEQELTRQTARRITREKIEPAAMDVDKNMAFPWQGITALAEAGFMGCSIPRAHGGLESNAITRSTVLESLAQGCASTALVCLTHWVATRALSVAATEEFRKRELHRLAAGGGIAAFAVHESVSGVVVSAIETKATRDGDGYVLDGSKIFITSAGEADVYVVLARSPESSDLVLLAVPKETPGLTFGQVDERMGLRGVSSRELRFDSVQVPFENLLGAEGKGLALVGLVVGEVALPGMAAIAVGISQACLALSVSHAKTRTIQQKPIGQTVAIKQKIASMAVSVDCMRSFLLDTSRGLDNDPQASSSTLGAAKAKLFATDQVLRVAETALQVHGGHGYCRDLQVERLYRDARGLSLHFKSSELLQEEIGTRTLES